MMRSNDVKGVDTVIGRAKVPLLVFNRHERVGKRAS
jgi:hypothetical protein